MIRARRWDEEVEVRFGMLAVGESMGIRGVIVWYWGSGEFGAWEYVTVLRECLGVVVDRVISIWLVVELQQCG